MVMEKVKDLILYQVATDRGYKVGDVLNFDKKTENGQYNRVFKSSFKLREVRLADEMYSVAKRKFKKFSSKNDIYEIAHKLEAYDVLVKEIALEEVRKEKFKDYPSRLHCMYLSINKEIALKNLKEMALSREKNGKNFQAVAVKLNGIIYKAGKVHMQREGESFAYYKEKALSYWSQNNVSDDEITEVLFEGKAEIVEILGEIKNS